MECPVCHSDTKIDQNSLLDKTEILLSCFECGRDYIIDSEDA